MMRNSWDQLPTAQELRDLQDRIAEMRRRGPVVLDAALVERWDLSLRQFRRHLERCEVCKVGFFEVVLDLMCGHGKSYMRRARKVSTQAGLDYLSLPIPRWLGMWEAGLTDVQRDRAWAIRG